MEVVLPVFLLSHHLVCCHNLTSDQQYLVQLCKSIAMKFYM